MLNILRKNNKNQKNTNNSYITKDEFFNIINKLMNKDFSLCTESEILDIDMRNKWNDLIYSQRNYNKDLLIMSNAIVSKLSSINSFISILSSINTEIDNINCIVSNNEHLNLSIDNVSYIANKVSSDASKAHAISSESIKNISDSINVVKKSFYDIKNISEEMSLSKDVLDCISEDIRTIKEIANETNLTALKTAIDASKIGTSGKSFSIIAVDLRKLAEHTKTSILKLEQNVLKLEKHIDLSTNKINSTSIELNNSRSLVNSALISIEKIQNSFKDVSDSLLQVASNSKERTAVTQEVTNSVMNISKYSNTITNNCCSTSNELFKVGLDLDNIRKYIYKSKNILSEVELFELFKTDHKIVNFRLYNKILSNSPCNLNDILSIDNCRLNSWINSKDSLAFKNVSEFNSLMLAHDEYHNALTACVDMYMDNDIINSKDLFIKIDNISNKLYDSIDIFISTFKK